MIEPQNTTMPLPAAPAPAEAPQGDGAGFGEMLAQSLGVAAAIDPNAVQQIAADPGEQSDGQAADLFSTDAEQEQVVDKNGRIPGMNRSIASSAVGTNPTVVARLPASSSVPVPDTGGFVDETVGLPVAKWSPPNRSLPKPVVPLHGSQVAAPVDGLGKPVLTEATPPISGHVEPPTEADPVDSIGVPVLTAEPEPPASTNPPDTTENPHLHPVVVDGPPVLVGRSPVPPETPTLPPQPRPLTEPPPSSGVAADPTSSEPMRSVDPNLLQSETLDPAPQRPGPARRTPVTPAPTVAEPVAVPAAGPDRVAWPATSAPRVDLGADAAVSLNSPQISVGRAAPAAPIPVSTEPAAPAAEPVPVSMADAPSAQPTATGVAPNIEPTPGSALAARVMRAVEMQANQPPPRTMIVDVPEIEGLRLVVSVRGGAQVHVVPTTGSLMNEGFQSFMEELSGVLADRGFEMTGEGRQRGNAHQQEEQPTPVRLHRPTFQRSPESDNDLRM